MPTKCREEKSEVMIYQRVWVPRSQKDMALFVSSDDLTRCFWAQPE
jgi:hypothetical protein